MSGLPLLLIVGTLLAVIVWRGLSTHREKSWDETQRDGWRERIAADPANCGAWEALGDSLRRAGRLDEARDAYVGALDAGGDTALLDTTRAKLRSVEGDLRTAARGGRAEVRPAEIVFCRTCGSPNSPLRARCEMCGRTLTYATFADALRDPEVRSATYESAAVLAVLWLCLQVFSELPDITKGAVALAAVMVIAWRFLRALDGNRG